MYQYGTHVLVDPKGNTIYALTSSSINLDNYVNMPVIVRGTIVIQQGALEGGPACVEVTAVH
ncbi:MAG TPA: hypothetical protein VI112_16765 [Bacteroidia bacterium]|jgi:hypothetical protein